MKQAIINLLKVKTLLSLGVVGVTCYLAIKNVISAEAFMGLAMAIVTYYFTKKEGE